MRYTLSFDPGTKQAGIGLFDGQRLIGAHLEKQDEGYIVERSYLVANNIVELINKKWSWLPKKNTKFVFEYPQFYKGKTPGNGDGLLALCLVLGGVGSLLMEQGFYQPLLVRPREWKLQTDADVMCRRIVKCLAPCEVAILEEFRAKRGAKDINHNVVDGVGIGMGELKRLPVPGTNINMWLRTDAQVGFVK